MLLATRHLIISSIVIIQIIESHCQNPIKEWKHPGSSHFIKSTDDPAEYCTCDFSKKFSKEAVKDVKEADLLRYYTKVLKFLFKRDLFHKDPDSKYLIRNVPLKLTENQLLELDTLELSISQIDSMVGVVFAQSKDKEIHVSLKTLFQAFYEQKIQSNIAFISSSISKISLALAALLLAYLLYKNILRPSLSGILLIIFFTFIGVSYSMSYLECMYDLESEHIIELTKHQNNPCEAFQKEKNSYFSFVKRLVLGSSESACHNYMRKTMRPSKTYCDPFQVCLKWAAKLKVDYLETFMSELMKMTSGITGDLGYFQKIVIWPIIFLFLVAIVVIMSIYFIKYTFRYLSESSNQPDPERLRRQHSIENLSPKPIVLVLNSSKLEQLGLNITESAVEIIPDSTELLPRIKALEIEKDNQVQNDVATEILDSEDFNEKEPMKRVKSDL